MKWKIKINKNKSLFFEKINKIHINTLHPKTYQEEREHKLPVLGMKWMLSVEILQTLFFN